MTNQKAPKAEFIHVESSADLEHFGRPGPGRGYEYADPLVAHIMERPCCYLASLGLIAALTWFIVAPWILNTAIPWVVGW